MSGKTPTWFKILIAALFITVLILLYLGLALVLEAWDDSYGA